MPKLTVGMPCYDDFDGVYFSVQSLRMYHSDIINDIEILIVDNNPDSEDGAATKSWVNDWVGNARYIPHKHSKGTATTKNVVFHEASSELVVCVDSHVMIEQDALRRLIEFYDNNPTCLDLLQGPMLYDDLGGFVTHMNPVWRGEMFGIWATDARGSIKQETIYDNSSGDMITEIRRTESPPFEIPMHGMGLFSCRKHAWLGFNKDFKGFGGEEGYIHEKYRQAGRKTLCLPYLRWVHRFTRPQGVKYTLTKYDKFRNYIIGALELHTDIQPIIEHFQPIMDRSEFVSVLSEFNIEY
jgi:glycosyltransferase involved in cell wall biosynthesis